MGFIIPIYKPLLNGNEKKYVNDCLDSSWISSRGDYIKKFEDGISGYLGVKHSTAVCNGTVALHLALVTLGIGENDEVIVPSFTYIASASSIVYTGATPVFVDSLESTWQMDPDDVKKKITNKTKAIMAVHIYGHPCEMKELQKIAKEYDLFLIEDTAEALGSKYDGKYAGTFGDISTLSFYGNKTLTTGEGGMVLTNDETLHDRAYHFKMHGLAKYREYWHDVIGYNYRMTNICAAIGLAQLETIEGRIKQKRQLVSWYIKYLKDLPIEYHREAKNVFHTYWMFTIVVENPQVRDELRNYLRDKGVETRPSFYPVHTMPMFSLKYQKHPFAEKIGWCGINLPSFPSLEENEVMDICSHIKNFYKL
jgi:perosamine synthetase